MKAYKVVTNHRSSICNITGMKLYYGMYNTVKAHEGTPGIFIFKRHEDAKSFVKRYSSNYKILDVDTIGKVRKCRRCFRRVHLFTLSNIKAWWRYHKDHQGQDPKKKGAATMVAPKGTFVCPAVKVLS